MKQFINKIQTSLRFFLVLVLLLTSFAADIAVFDLPEKVQASDFNPSNLISDGAFVNKNSMSEDDIQRFLERKGSLLKDFTQDGKRASKIIYDAAQGTTSSNIWANFGHSDWNENVSINPQVLLVTIQKEEGLIEGYYSKQENYNQVRLDWAVGYGYTESTIYNEYKGFYNQINLGAWQLYWNYERAQGLGYSDYQVGQDFCFDGDCGRFDNRATASLYRYTPHVYNGNYNFWYYFNNWFVQREYEAALVSQSGYPTLQQGESTTLEVKFRNTGTSTWSSGGSNRVILALDKYWASSTAWQGSGWYSENRLATAQEGDVAPGDVGTFRFNISCPSDMPAGAHKFSVRLVAENLTWFDNPDTNGGAWWNINVPRPQAEWQGQSGSVTAWPGESADMNVTFKNTGSTSWKISSYPVNLAIDKYQNEDFLKKFRHSSWISENRIATIPRSTINNGETATFNFSIQIPSDLKPGKYRFHVRLVSDGYSWFDNPETNGGAWWEINVPEPKAEWVEQSSVPNLQRGDAQTIWVKFKNTSGVTWRSGGPNPVSLAIDKYWASKTAWQGQGWLSENRITKAQEGDIANGSVGTYRFNIYVPTDMPSGKHRFYVRLVSDGYSWFDNPDTNGGAWWEFNVL